MKKLLAILAVVMLAVLPAAARDRVTTDVNVLPANAQKILNTHFKGIKVNHIKIDSNVIGQKDYDVILCNGFEIDFDKDGNIDEVDCGYEAVPAGLILKPIRDYVAQNFSGQKIVSMDVNRHSYDIELSNGTELVFDRNGNFRRIDD